MLQIRIQNKFQEIMSLKFSSTCLNCSLLLAFMLLLQTAVAQYNFSGVDQLIAAKKQALGGKLVTLVAKDGKITYKSEVGDDFKMETPEQIGTSSKWLTAALVMTFVDKKELSLDDPVAKYLPIFGSYSKAYITIRHCLAEITGIESEEKKVSRLLQKKKFGSLEAEVNYYASHKNIVTQPGKEFFYGDVAYNTLGRVLEVIAKKKTFSKLMQERITKPSGMKKTNFLNDRGPEDPSAGAVSTAGDYIRFMTMLLNDGMANGKQVLSKEAIAEMEKVGFSGLPVKSAPKFAKGFNYGFGVWVQEADKNGKSSVISCPGVEGCWPYLDRCRNYACIILTPQRDNEQTQQVFLEIKEAIEKQMKSECN
jgi:CubicO group peptidase (beta-lactamase class C family)